MAIPDRIVRGAIAAVLAAMFYTEVLSGAAGVIALVIAGILLVTALLGMCPLYSALGIRTRN